MQKEFARALRQTRMNKFLLFTFAAFVTFTSTAFAADGLIAVKSPYAVRETLDRFEVNAKQRGLKVFARIDHSAGAASVGKALRPTEVLIFGGPQGGTPFMECAQSVGIDLPLKALAWLQRSCLRGTTPRRRAMSSGSTTEQGHGSARR
jgi:uncharacterized protein (DUF302 family)